MVGRKAVVRTGSRGAGGAARQSAVRRALQHYADRGVFRGFSAVARRNGVEEYRFSWLTREPMTVTYDPAASTLTFKNLLPDVARASPLLADVAALIGSRSSRTLPAHRRIDGRRATVGWAERRRAVSVALEFRDRHQAYAVQKGVNLVNEIFTLLQVSYPDYLWKQFGLPAE